MCLCSYLFGVKGNNLATDYNQVFICMKIQKSSLCVLRQGLATLGGPEFYVLPQPTPQNAMMTVECHKAWLKSN